MKRVVSSTVGLMVAALALTVPGPAHAAPTPVPAPSATAAPASPKATPTAAPTSAPASTAPTPSTAPASPQATATSTVAIDDLWRKEGGAAGWLGTKVGAETAVNGGVRQAFTGGDIYYSPKGTFWIKGSIKKKYDAAGGAASNLGLPASNELAGPNGSKYQKFGNGTIAWSPATGAFGVVGTIARKYDALGGVTSSLGLPVSDEFNGQNNTRVSRFTNGVIIYNKNSGAAFEVEGAIYEKYGVFGWEGGQLGRPVSDEFTGANGARVSRFERGIIVWKPETGANAVYGSILDTYGAHGWEGGSLGAPTSDEFDAGRGSRGQRFQNGLILWSPGTGAMAVQGHILDNYAAHGWENGVLGLPISNEFNGAAPGSRVSRFQGGVIIWSPDTGAHAVYGSIYEAYGALGWEGGPLGMPISEEFDAGRGSRAVNFQGGVILWSPGTGAHAVYGQIYPNYGFHGFENGVLGLPVTDEFDGRNGTRVQGFEGGQIVWSPSTGAHAVYGSIYQTYAGQGWEGGPLGPPVTDEFNGAHGARVTRFASGGVIIWKPETGAFAVQGAILAEYGRQGYEGGPLGAPIGPETPVAGGWTQDFQNARIEFINGQFRTVWPGPQVDARCMSGRVMCISKADRKLRWMIDGRVIREMDARFGATSTPTREGEFTVFSKVRNEISWMYGNTPMPFAMYFSGGEAVHYSYDFAARGYAGASHGCVNIRDWDGIQWLFDTQVRVGDKVVVYW